jgi:nicotinamidase-related amidase
MSRTHSEGLEPGAWKIIAVAILGPFMSGVESTARAAHEHGYAVVPAEDAATSFSAEMHAFAFEHIFPHPGGVAKADEMEL